MKKLLLTFVAMATSAMCFAQLQLATLEHEDSVSVYYGASALIEAHAAAVDGDIITLSSGMFTATNLTKLVTVRGAGMFNDTAAGTTRTVISGNFNIGRTPIDSTRHITLEGLHMNGKITCLKLYMPWFVKCYLDEFITSGSNGFEKGEVVNCIIKKCSFIVGSGTININNTMFVNSVILNFMSVNSSYFRGNTFTNCICGIGNSENYHQYSQFNNCILFCNNNNSGTYTSSGTTYYYPANSSEYCIGINQNTSHTYYSSYIYLDGRAPLIENHHLHNYGSLDAIFKTFRGSYEDNATSFELQDSIATTILGSDGTQVGIYGGPMPFDPYVYNHKVSAARRTTPDGFLDLEIKLYDEE